MNLEQRHEARSDDGGKRAAAIYTLSETCKLNGVDPQAWLGDILARIADRPAKRIGGLLAYNWSPPVRSDGPTASRSRS